MKRLIFDLDGTLTFDQPGTDYSLRSPRLDIIDRLKYYKSIGFVIVIMTARNMQTHKNSIGIINAKTLPNIIEWLNRHEIPYDEIHVGKPWCGTQGFYIDDKAIRPDEFTNLSYEQIRLLINIDEDS